MSSVIVQEPPWPTVIDLVPHVPLRVALHACAGGDVTLELSDVRHAWSRNRWLAPQGGRHLVGAAVRLRVDDAVYVLAVGPYVPPRTCGRVRVLVETTRAWGEQAEVARIDDLRGGVRLSIVARDAAWGVPMRFPLPECHWQGSSYHNTWLALVPYNKLYYHRGEDFGAIPSCAHVVAPWDGTVRARPPADGDGRSNAVAIDSPAGMQVRFAHQDTGGIAPVVQVGRRVAAGTVLGVTGQTWLGRPQQDMDPHLHMQCDLADTRVSPTPYLVDAWLRESGEDVLPLAGAPAFGVVGETLVLKGRVACAAGVEVTRAVWQLPNGRVVEGASAALRLEAPGHGLATFTVTTRDARSYCATLPVRADGPDADPGEEPFGWLHAHPTRHVRVGDAVRCWNRVARLDDATLDPGDGRPAEPVGREAHLRWDAPGLYTVRLRGRSRHGAPFCTGLPLRVHP